MKPIDEFFQIAREAELKTHAEDWRGDPDMEPFCLRIVELIRANSGLRAEFSEGFKKIVCEPGLGDWEIILLCMHILRWPEIEDWAHTRHRQCIATKDWRGEPVYRRILETFEGDWGKDQIYEYTRKGA